MKRSMMTCVATATLVLSGAGAANAGEVNGNGEPTPIKDHRANSICSFSGLDTQDASAGGTEVQPPMFDDDALAVRGNQKHGYHGVQNYGIFVKAGLKEFLPFTPGQACNGSGG